jgi:hypothetical protein
MLLSRLAGLPFACCVDAQTAAQTEAPAAFGAVAKPAGVKLKPEVSKKESQ